VSHSKRRGVWRAATKCSLLVTVATAWIAPVARAADLETQSRQVSGFHELQASISGDIRLRRGETETLVIEARPDTLERLVTEVDDGVLRIRQAAGSNWWRNSGPIRIDITYQHLDALEMNGSADVTTDALRSERFRVGISGSSNVRVPQLQVQTLDVRVQGSGDLDVASLDAGTVDLDVSGSGDVRLAGRASRQVISVRGSGRIDNDRLESADAEVSVSGSGNVSIWVMDRLEARISGSGDIRYRGDAQVESRITGSGELKAF